MSHARYTLGGAPRGGRRDRRRGGALGELKHAKIVTIYLGQFLNENCTANGRRRIALLDRR